MSRVSSAKEKMMMMSLVRAVEQQGTDAALGHLADAFLDPACACDLVVLGSSRALLLMDDKVENPRYLFLTRAKEVCQTCARKGL